MQKLKQQVQSPLTGFAIVVPNWLDVLILNPAGTLAAGAITFPHGSNGQVFRISTTQIVTALTLTPNTNQVINGLITALTAGGTHAWIFDGPSQSWYKLS